MAKLTIRIDFDGGSLGPGKVRLLELIAETGSIRKAAAGMKMSYRKAWLLLKALEETFGAALVGTATGGKAGGGARLLLLGKLVVGHYRDLEGAAGRATRSHLSALVAKAKPVSSKPAKKRRLKRKILK